ncbi:hypothetical protein BKI52_42420 [marine bacterium AO1-C]|nr:hypothetical protein BKI52_42420 [marine bacterium AO1-C]
MPTIKLLLYIIFTLLISTRVTAQNSIRGKITAQDNKEIVAGASVYISNTTIGTATDGKGLFKLNNIPKIPFDLNISSIGFKTKVLRINPLKDTVLNITLAPQVQKLREVVVRPKDDDLWEKFGQKFIEDLIGYSKFSRQCKIENIQHVILEYDKSQQKLTAFCREPLIIVNRALGYKIKYWLEAYEYSFYTRRVFVSGYPFFEDLATTKASRRKVKRYKKNRSRAFNGSLTHFIQALYAGKVKEAGFRVDLMQQVEVSKAYKPNVKKTDTIFYNNATVEKIYQSILTKTKNEAFAKRYLQSIKKWYKSKSKKDLRFKLFYKSGQKRIVEAYELSRDQLNPEKVTVSNYQVDPKIERRAKKGKVNVIVARNIDVNQYVKTINNAGKLFKFQHFLYITYRKEIEEEAYQRRQYPFSDFVRKKQTTILSMLHQSGILIYSNGYFYPPINLLSEGYWAFEKVDKLLPLDYNNK